VRPLWLFGTLPLLALGACGGDRGPSTLPKAKATVRVTSHAFADGGAIPRRFTCDGAGVSPPLRWAGVPQQAASIALIVSDPDAPGGRFVHWTLYDLPPQVSRLPTGAPVLAGARQGRNSLGKVGWAPPCPPKTDPAHHYDFDVYWLGRPVDVPQGAKAQDVLSAIAGAAGGHGRLVGTYKRR
jgi:Raf kinase inhibitor-like YbhB/YbcL family protein